MNNKVLALLLLTSISTYAQEHKENHSHTIEFHDFSINIEGLPDPFERVSRPPTPPISYEQLVERHKYQLKKTKIRVTAFVTIATAIIVGGVGLLIHYSTGGCAT
jgi:hypothetical protein